MLEGGRQLAYTHNKCGHAEGEGSEKARRETDACVCGMFDGEIDRRRPAGDTAWTRMSEGERARVSLRIEQIAAWVGSPSLHATLPGCRRRSRTDERPWFDAEYIFIQLHRLKRRKGEETNFGF